MSEEEYKVLARKYRPQNFDDLVGQEVLVRTLSNAIKNNRLAHAYILTGIRGIGKTTTARIIAKSLNCIGNDSESAVANPCGKCANCVQITEDRHVDVMEMDAASRTGVGDIRELIETVHYAPTQARYKIYIIDEVHMLSTSAFNALLKTLEEPPTHVKFIFATTEIRKIPVTILSRCQRFDLKRLDVDMLSQHLENICAKESINHEKSGLDLIAMAAEGSVRDALSLLDRAISHAYDESGNQQAVTSSSIRKMLGLTDKTNIFEIMESIFSGNAIEAMKALRERHQGGSDIMLLLGDMLTVIHVLTRLKIDTKDDLGPVYSKEEKEYAASLAKKLSIPTLTRAWQTMLKAIDEVKRAPNPLMAAEMSIIRLCHMSSLPLPEQIIKEVRASTNNAQIASGPATTAPRAASGNYGSGGSGSAATAVKIEPSFDEETMLAGDQIAQEDKRPHLSLAADNSKISLNRVEDIIQYLEDKKEMRLKYILENSVIPVSFKVGELGLKRLENIDNDSIRALKENLAQASGAEWSIAWIDDAPASLNTIAETKRIRKNKELDEAAAISEVKEILDAFEGSKIINIKDARNNK